LGFFYEIEKACKGLVSWERQFLRGATFDDQSTLLPMRIIKYRGEERRFLESRGAASALVLPLTMGEELVGFLGLDNLPEEETEKPADLALAVTIAQLIAHALHRRRSQDTSAQSDRLLSALMDQPHTVELVPPDSTRSWLFSSRSILMFRSRTWMKGRPLSGL